MRLWRPDPADEWPRADLRRMHGVILDAFRRRGEDAPRVVAIATAYSNFDDHLYEIFFELTPGVVMSAAWDLTEDEKCEKILDIRDPAAGNYGTIAAAALDGVRAYLSLGIDHLADRLHDLRLRIRAKLADLSGEGGGPRLISLRLTSNNWHYPDEFNVILRLTCLDRYLFPDVEELQIDDACAVKPADAVNAVEAELDHWGSAAARGYALRHALAREGATGTIDLLTLNAISRLGDVCSTLRAPRRGLRPRGADYFELFGERGNLSSCGFEPSTRLSWSKRSISHPTVLPATVLAACAGRPITDLITHPILSSEMTIVEATRNSKTGALSVKFEQPRRLFCHHSGRAWQGRTPEHEL